MSWLLLEVALLLLYRLVEERIPDWSQSSHSGFCITDNLYTEGSDKNANYELLKVEIWLVDLLF